MMKKITTVTLEPEVLKESLKILQNQDKKLSPVVNSLLKKYVIQDANRRN